ncbi:hypothetical protein [Mediterraneibacter gnavus]
MSRCSRHSAASVRFCRRKARRNKKIPQKEKRGIRSPSDQMP